MAISLESLMRFGYGLILVTIGLMIWASSVNGRELEVNYPPCTFNALCTCSKAMPDLGIVQCKDVPFASIPRSINSSKVFMLKMENTGLRDIEGYFLQATGLYKLEINNNPISDISEDAFAGLERSLWVLALRNNKLIDVPTKSLRYLQKLIHLDLSGNEISIIDIESFKGLRNSLQYLILAHNSITDISADAFQGLPNLDTIDLSNNNLMKIDPNVFADGMGRLTKVILADNLLKEIPYNALAPLKSLRILDLSSNRIMNFLPEENNVNPYAKLSLDALHLEYNQIEIIVPASFQYFSIVNQTFLDFNPIQMISDDGFQSAKIRELYIRHCKLNYVSPSAFLSLEGSLQILDLSGNNISGFPDKIFANFDSLRSLSLRDNKITNISPKDLFGGFQYTLFNYDVSGDMNGQAIWQDLKKMNNLRSLALSKSNTQHLSPDDFLEFGVELENLKIFRAGLKSIKNHAFMHVRGLRKLDLSENRIEGIERDAFEEIGHSLTSLKISHGFSMTQLPIDAMRHLTAIQELDFNNNRIKSLPDTSFHFLKDLRILEMNDNHIEQLYKGTFQSDYHSNLEEVSLAYNLIRHVSQHTFVDLEKLQKIRLEDNKIERLERRAFMNLNQLKYLNLRGNKINSISDEAFQDKRSRLDDYVDTQIVLRKFSLNYPASPNISGNVKSLTRCCIDYVESEKYETELNDLRKKKQEEEEEEEKKLIEIKRQLEASEPSTSNIHVSKKRKGLKRKIKALKSPNKKVRQRKRKSEIEKLIDAQKEAGKMLFGETSKIERPKSRAVNYMEEFGEDCVDEIDFNEHVLVEESLKSAGLLQNEVISDVDNRASEDERISCNKCSKSCKNVKRLAKHQLKHLKLNVWNMCDVPTQTSSIHFLYFCRLCPDRFRNDPSKLDKHYRDVHKISNSSFEIEKMLNDLEGPTPSIGSLITKPRKRVSTFRDSSPGSSYEPSIYGSTSSMSLSEYLSASNTSLSSNNSDTFITTDSSSTNSEASKSSKSSRKRKRRRIITSSEDSSESDVDPAKSKTEEKTNVTSIPNDQTVSKPNSRRSSLSSVEEGDKNKEKKKSKKTRRDSDIEILHRGDLRMVFKKYPVLKEKNYNTPTNEAVAPANITSTEKSPEKPLSNTSNSSTNGDLIISNITSISPQVFQELPNDSENSEDLIPEEPVQTEPVVKKQQGIKVRSLSSLLDAEHLQRNKMNGQETPIIPQNHLEITWDEDNVQQSNMLMGQPQVNQYGNGYMNPHQRMNIPMTQIPIPPSQIGQISIIPNLNNSNQNMQPNIQNYQNNQRTMMQMQQHNQYMGQQQNVPNQLTYQSVTMPQVQIPNNHMQQQHQLLQQNRQSPLQYQQLQQNSTQQFFKCNVCLMVFSNRYVCQEHFRSVHLNAQNGKSVIVRNNNNNNNISNNNNDNTFNILKYPVKCQFCDNRFSTGSEAQNHINLVHLHLSSNH